MLSPSLKSSQKYDIEFFCTSKQHLKQQALQPIQSNTLNIVNILQLNIKVEMRHWSKIKEAMKNRSKYSYIKSPVGIILAINTGLFLWWRMKETPSKFLVKHFSFERFNSKNHRFHTMITYAFSHFSPTSFVLNMAILMGVGRTIHLKSGARYVWLLYLLGGIFGAIGMQLAMPYNLVVMPQAGADASICSLLTFYCLYSLQTRTIFYYPIQLFLLSMGIYGIIEPQKKKLGGIIAGVLIYQLFKFKIV